MTTIITIHTCTAQVLFELNHTNTIIGLSEQCQDSIVIVKCDPLGINTIFAEEEPGDWGNVMDFDGDNETLRS